LESSRDLDVWQDRLGFRKWLSERKAEKKHDQLCELPAVLRVFQRLNQFGRGVISRFTSTDAFFSIDTFFARLSNFLKRSSSP
jgi:hypothetical protein